MKFILLINVKMPTIVGNWVQWKLSFTSGPEVISLFPSSTQLSTKFILLINVKMPTIVGILTFISMINTTSERLYARNFFICRYFSFYKQLKFRAPWTKSYNLRARYAKSQAQDHQWISSNGHMIWTLQLKTGPWRKKPCLTSFLPGKTKSSLLSYRD